jgi:UDP-N-acetyl-D-mannosaminuronic acid dehydrogenase
MSLEALRGKIEERSARLAVIGLGYVGLPVACQFAKAGFDVLGVELRPEVIDKVNRGVSPIEGNEPGLAELLEEVIASGRLAATANYGRLQDRDAIIIAVETPVDESHTPRYGALRSVLESLRPNLKPGALVIVESTIAPGTMERLVLPALEQGGERRLNRDFYLGHCPERVMPGRLLANLENMSRAVGGMTPETAEAMAALYRHTVKADLDPTDCITAELVKTTENTYRDVQIAFANEVALICEAVGGDVWKVRELVNKSPYRNMHLPGAGVGGHCIPKDPWLLAYAVRDEGVPLRLIPAARAVNDSMPLHMVAILEEALASQGRELHGSKILVMGYAYLEDSDDTRNSPSEVLVQRLSELGAEVVIHDPYVAPYQGELLLMAQGCDAAVVMVRHKEYSQIDLGELARCLSTSLLIDGRNLFNENLVQAAGLHFRGVGMRYNDF